MGERGGRPLVLRPRRRQQREDPDVQRDRRENRRVIAAVIPISGRRGITVRLQAPAPDRLSRRRGRGGGRCARDPRRPPPPTGPRCAADRERRSAATGTYLSSL